MALEKIDRSSKVQENSNFTIEMFKNWADKGVLDLDMDYQREFVWDDERKYELIDSLLRGDRIPEIHIITDGTIRKVVDGKQRLSTLLSFINGEFSVPKKYFGTDLHYLFNEIGDGKKIGFFDFDSDDQARILDTNIHTNLYKDMQERDVARLFRKLNNGKSVNNFTKQMASNIPIRKYYTSNLLDHFALTELFSQKKIDSEGGVEAYLVGILILMRAYDEMGVITPVSLENTQMLYTPGKRQKFFLPNLEEISDSELQDLIADLQEKQLIVAKYLDQICQMGISYQEHKKTIKRLGLIFPIFYAYALDLTDSQFKQLFILLNDEDEFSIAKVLGSTSGNVNQLRPVTKYMEYIQKNIIPKIQH